MFKVNNRNTRKRCEICSKLTINNNIPFPSLFIARFEQVNVCWVSTRKFFFILKIRITSKYWSRIYENCVSTLACIREFLFCKCVSHCFVDALLLILTEFKSLCMRKLAKSLNSTGWRVMIREMSWWLDRDIVTATVQKF